MKVYVLEGVNWLDYNESRQVFGAFSALCAAVEHAERLTARAREQGEWIAVEKWEVTGWDGGTEGTMHGPLDGPVQS